MSDSEDDENDNGRLEMENGHISDFVPELDDNESTDEEEPVAQTSSDQFDRDLPTTHRYLGKLNNVSGFTLFEHGENVQILAICTNTLVFPGFTLPLILTYEESMVMQRFIEKSNVFVLICINQTADHYEFFRYCVTMEVFESQMKNNGLNIKARGRQRCRLVPGSEKRPLAGRLREVRVEMMVEPKICSPISDTQMLTLKWRRSDVLRSYGDVLTNNKYMRYHLSQFPLAGWVYKEYEVCYYVKHIMDRLTNYSGQYIPEGPEQLAYWVAQNYQLRHDERLRILELNSTLERLRLELHFLKLEREMRCLSCDEKITDPSLIISMSKDGIQSNYVNPGGHVYETVTVSSAENFILVGHPSKQFSWFPGYAWTIIQCLSCSRHLGWRFTSSALKPNCFYGLAKSSFVVTIKSKRDTEIYHQRTTYSEGYLPDW